MHDAGRCNYMPVNMGNIGDYYARNTDPVDIVPIKPTTVDSDGCFNFSAATLWHRAIIERASLVIVEFRSAPPYCQGIDNFVHINEVDCIIAGDNALVSEPPKQHFE